jgi:cargo-transport protein YPP1
MDSQLTSLSRGSLSNAKGTPYVALREFESALNHFPDHASAIVGLSNILLDIYTETLLPPPTNPSIDPATSLQPLSLLNSSMSTNPQSPPGLDAAIHLDSPAAYASPVGPLGLPAADNTSSQPKSSSSHTTFSTGLLDRLAARDRAYGLLSSLTKLGTGWNYSDAWFTLARAHEEAGQVDKARDALWWCVELEEGRAVRNWRCVAAGGYVL